jgi:hypothetical protein
MLSKEVLPPALVAASELFCKELSGRPQVELERGLKE